MKYELLNRRLAEVFRVGENGIRNEHIEAKGLSMMKLRDILLGIGHIYREDLENNTYFAVIGGGTGRRNKAKAVIKLVDEELMVAIYAKEGIVNQNTCQGIINELKKQIREEM